MRLHGAPEAEIQAAMEAERFYLRPANLPALRLFGATITQWRWIGGPVGTRRTGLDYSAVERAAPHLEIKLTPALFSDLQHCEAEALKFWCEQAQ